MPRKPPTTMEDFLTRAARAFLRGTRHTSPHAAIQAGARTEDQWQAHLDGARAHFYSTNGLRARQSVKARHPMRKAQ